MKLNRQFKKIKKQSKNIPLQYIGILLLISLIVFGAAMGGSGDKNIENKKLLESQYGSIGAWFGVGDRLYEVTYTNGVTQTVFERSKSLLGKATIIEIPGGTTVWQTAGKPAYLNFRAKGIDLDKFRAPGATTTKHRFEVADITGSYRWVTTVTADMLINPSASQNKVTIEIPAEAANKRYFLVKEYVQARDGAWIAGAESKSSDVTFEVIWTQSTQAGTATPSIPTPLPTSAPTNPDYKPPAPAKEILVESVPSGATVQLSGAAIGNTPVLLTLFETDGTKTLVVSKGGYLTKMVSVSASTSSPLTVTLESSTSAPPPPPLPPTTTPTPPLPPTTTSSPSPETTTSSPTPPPAQGADDNGGEIWGGNADGTGTGGDSSGYTLDSETEYSCPSGYELKQSESGPTCEKPKDAPGFEAVFALIGLVIVAYFVLRRDNGR